MKIVIRAGGVGSRLWPVSRQAKAKQFHAFTSEETMLQEAIDRVNGLAAPEDMYISTNTKSEELVRSQYSTIPNQNIIVEPARKDTAAAIGLESIVIRKHDPNAIVASLGSDHSIKHGDEFQRVLRIAEQFVTGHPEYMVAVGLRPTHADTGYGYIECGEVLQEIDGSAIHNVNQFREKPDEVTAKQFIAQPNFLWNGNMFVWKVSTVLDLYEKHLPEMYAELLKIEAALGTSEEKAVIEEVYPQLEKIAVDYAIIEKTDKIAGMAADIGWNDIGDWARLKDELAQTEAENVVIGAELLDRDTSNTLVYSSEKGKKIATIGVENLIIVDTGDALLICDKYKSQEVKKIVEQLEENGNTEVL